MNILVIADAKLPVPPTEYGGAERIISYLCDGLRARGHCVDLMAGPGSQNYGGKVWLHYPPSRNRLSRAGRKLRFQFLSLRAVCGADVVVNFGRLDYLHSVLRSDTPLVCCFQNPVPQSEVDWLLARRKCRLALVGVSHAQIAERLPNELFTVIHNCTAPERMAFRVEPDAEPYLVFLGRLTENKGADTAMRVARRCGIKLIIAGNVSDEPGGREFFEREIKPNLSEQVKWIGPVGDTSKLNLLGGARALLFPIRWNEPFGIVMAESLACGTPVIAMRCASTPEVIDEGRTGFLADNEDGLVAAVARIEEIDRAECRRIAVQRFSPQRLVGDYLRCIEKARA